MRISDWSSDVCSSDLPSLGVVGGLREVAGARHRRHQFLEAPAGNQHVAHTGVEIAVASIAQHQLFVGVEEREAAGQRFDRLTQPLLRRRRRHLGAPLRSEEHTSELQSLMRISYAVFCLKKKNETPNNTQPLRTNT